MFKKNARKARHYKMTGDFIRKGELTRKETNGGQIDRTQRKTDFLMIAETWQGLRRREAFHNRLLLCEIGCRFVKFIEE